MDYLKFIVPFASTFAGFSFISTKMKNPSYKNMFFVLMAVVLIEESGKRIEEIFSNTRRVQNFSKSKVEE